MDEKTQSNQRASVRRERERELKGWELWSQPDIGSSPKSCWIWETMCSMTPTPTDFYNIFPFDCSLTSALGSHWTSPEISMLVNTDHLLGGGKNLTIYDWLAMCTCLSTMLPLINGKLYPKIAVPNVVLIFFLTICSILYNDKMVALFLTLNMMFPWELILKKCCMV